MKTAKEMLKNLTALKGPFSKFYTDKLPKNPETLFLKWLYEAIEENVHEPHAMTVSTVDANGAPDARILILKNVSDNRWFFASSSESKKGQHLQLQPRIALTFYWSEIGKQVGIRGIAYESGREASEKDFLER